MSKYFKKFLTESQAKLDPMMKVGDTLRLNINAKDVVEMRITEISENKIKAKPDYLDFDKDGDEAEPMKKALKDKEDVEEGRKALPPGFKNKGWNKNVKSDKKPDYLDFDKDGNKDEPMTKALKDKQQVSENTVYPNATVIKSKNGKPIGEIYKDEHGWGCFHYNADRGYDAIDSKEEALEMLKQLHDETRRVRESSFFKTLLKNAGVKVVTEEDLNKQQKYKVEVEGDEGDGNFKVTVTASSEKEALSKAMKNARSEYDIHPVGAKIVRENTLNAIRKLSGLQPVTESYHTLEDIIDNHPDLVSQFENGEMPEELESMLYDYYSNSGQMPYGTMKARTGDPSNWITDQFQKDLEYYGKGQTNEDSKSHNTPGPVYIKKADQADFERWMDSEGYETEVPKTEEGEYVVYDYTGSNLPSYWEATSWDDQPVQSMGEEFELHEGKLVYMDDTYELNLDHNTRTWSADIWTTKRVR